MERKRYNMIKSLKENNQIVVNFLEDINMQAKFGVFLDIDGCLTSSDGNVCLDHYVANSAIADLVRRGHVGAGPSIRLCSGRDINSVEVIANFFGMVNSWMIVEGGVALFNPTTREIKSNPAITPEVKKLFRRIGAKIVPTILKRYKCLQPYLGNMVSHSLELRTGSNISIETVLDFLKGPKREGEFKRKRGLLTGLIGKRKIKVVRYFNRAVDIFPPGVNKGTDAKFLMELEGWDPSWCIAVGDSELDFPLFRSVGRFGCPSNATPACLKFVRDHRMKVSNQPYTRGVYDVLDYFLRIEP
jgi:HAD superfamily hydrolase (TIGR01484 family)